jgi:hypothetical protein
VKTSAYHVNLDTCVDGIDIEKKESLIKQCISVNGVVVAKGIPGKIYRGLMTWLELR